MNRIRIEFEESFVRELVTNENSPTGFANISLRRYGLKNSPRDSLGHPRDPDHL